MHCTHSIDHYLRQNLSGDVEGQQTSHSHYGGFLTFLKMLSLIFFNCRWFSISHLSISISLVKLWRRISFKAVISFYPRMDLSSQSSTSTALSTTYSMHRLAFICRRPRFISRCKHLKRHDKLRKLQLNVKFCVFGRTKRPDLGEVTTVAPIISTFISIKFQKNARSGPKRRSIKSLIH